MTLSASSRVSVTPGGLEQAKLIQECNGSPYNLQPWLRRFGYFSLFMRESSKNGRKFWGWVYFFCFYALVRKNCDKLLLDSSCLSIRLSVRMSVWNNSVITGRVFMKFDILGSPSAPKVYHENSIIIKI